MQNNVSQKIKNAHEWILGLDISLAAWFSGFICLVALRFFMESFSNPSLTGYLASDFSTMIHYALFYLGAAISFILLLEIYIPGVKAHGLVLFGLIIIITPPILDVAFSGGSSYPMSYIFQTPPRLFQSFTTFFGKYFLRGVTPGIRVEVAIIVSSVAAAVWAIRKSILRGVFAGLSAYALLFFWLALPSFVGLAGAVTGQSPAGLGPLSFFENSQNNSIISKNFIHPADTPHGVRASEVFFNASLSHVLFIIVIFLSAIWFYKNHRKSFTLIVKNSRPERVLHCFFMVFVGIALAWNGAATSFNWLDILSLMVFLLSVYFSWMFAVGVNDICDFSADKISNPKRPLASGAISLSFMKNTNSVFLALSLVGACLAGSYSLFYILSFTASYFIYSSPPLRLKRFPVVATLMIAIASLSMAMAGFFLISGSKLVSAFPLNYVYLIIFAFTAGATIKDLKDTKGDQSDGVFTIPVIFGEQRGKTIIAGLVSAAIVVSAAIINALVLMPAALIASILVIYYIFKHNYNEKPIFVVYLTYLLFVILERLL